MTLHDLRYAFRQLRKSPGFTLTAVTVLTLGIGANIAVFTVLNGVLLRPLPYHQPGRIAIVEPSGPHAFYAMSYADMVQLSDAVGPEAQTGTVVRQTMASLVGPGGRVQAKNICVTPGLFNVLGVQPALGRVFRPDENESGDNRTIVIGDSVWRRLFNADPQVIGKTLTLKEQAFTVVGVMPKAFSFPFEEGMQIWSPAEIPSAARSAMAGDNVLGIDNFYLRMPQSLNSAQLLQLLNRTQSIVAREVADDDTPPAMKVTVYQDSLNEQARKPLLLLYAVVFGIWLLACLNVTSLMLTRAVARSHEQAVRSALGASRARLVQQCLVEGLMLSGIGAVCGLLLGQAAIKFLWRQIAHKLPMASAIQIDWRVMAGLVLLTLLTAAVAGIFPAARALRANLQSGLHGTTATASASQIRTRELLVVAQLALTLVFLTGAGLFLRTIYALRQVPLGFAQQNVLTGGIIFNGGWHRGEDRAGGAGEVNVINTLYLPLLERLRAMPGVQVASLSSVLPFRAEFRVTIIGALDHKDHPRGQGPLADGRLASSGLTDALGIPMVRGRFFDASDGLGSPAVVVVNKAFADKYLPNQDPIGHIYSMGKGRFAEARIVGVIGDTKQGTVTDATRPEVYFCLAQMEPGGPLYGIATAFIQVAIRATVPVGTLRVQFDKTLHEVAPDATTINVETIHEAVEDSFGSQTLIARLLEGFAGMALAIAVVGLYGLLSFAVAQRTREIGLRIALGAPQTSILNLVFRRAAILVGLGLAAGGGIAWFAVTLARTYIFGVEARDAINFAAVGLILVLASLVAALIPARRAASIDPMQALRAE
jgi:predicted permease